MDSPAKTSIEAKEESKSDEETYTLEGKDFRRLLKRKVSRVVGYAALLRFTIKLLFKRLNVLKALKEPLAVI